MSHLGSVRAGVERRQRWKSGVGESETFAGLILIPVFLLDAVRVAGSWFLVWLLLLLSFAVACIIKAQAHLFTLKNLINRLIVSEVGCCFRDDSGLNCVTIIIDSPLFPHVPRVG